MARSPCDWSSSFLVLFLVMRGTKKGVTSSSCSFTVQGSAISLRSSSCLYRCEMTFKAQDQYPTDAVSFSAFTKYVYACIYIYMCISKLYWFCTYLNIYKISLYSYLQFHSNIVGFTQICPLTSHLALFFGCHHLYISIWVIDSWFLLITVSPPLPSDIILAPWEPPSPMLCCLPQPDPSGSLTSWARSLHPFTSVQNPTLLRAP